MKINLFSKAAIVGAALMVSQGAFAATLDFAAEADGINGERGVADFTTLVDMQGSGIDVTLSADGGSAYLDSGNAGLGVCSTLTTPGNQCNPSSDDNVSVTETVFMSLAPTATGVDQVGRIASGFFRDAVHNSFEGNLDYSLDGGTTWMTAIILAGANGVYDFGNALYTAAGLGFKYTDDEFYVATLDIQPVPLPAAGILLLGGIGGLGGLSAIRRRRRKEA